MKSKSLLSLIKFLNFLFNSVQAKNEFLIEWICFAQLFSWYHLVVSRQVRSSEREKLREGLSKLVNGLSRSRQSRVNNCLQVER